MDDIVQVILELSEWPSLARIIQPFYSVNSLLITHSTSNTLIYAVMPSCTKNEIKRISAGSIIAAAAKI